MRRSGWVGLCGAVSSVVVCGVASAGDLSRLEHSLKVLKTDRSYKVRLAAARGLGRTRALAPSERAAILRALQDCLLDPHPLVRGICASGLGAQNAWTARARLSRMASEDPQPFPKAMARKALRLLQPPNRAQTPRLKMGLVRVTNSGSLSAQHHTALQQRASNAIEDRIEPYRPALFPREQADLQIDVSITRSAAPSGTRGRSLRFEVRVLLVEVPGAQLRHASEATASMRSTRRQSSNAEANLMLRAVDRAVQEALSLVYTP